MTRAVSLRRPHPALILAAMLASATPAAAAERGSVLARALSCQIADGELAKLMDTLAREDTGMKTPTQSLAAPSGALYRLASPVSALGYSATEIYVSPSRIAMVVSGQPLASVSARLKLEPEPYGPAARPIDDTHKVIAYELHQSPLAGKVLVGCEYGNPDAQTWLAPDMSGF